MTIKAFDEDTHPEETEVVLPFSGPISEIPEGWAVADGSLGTIDMRDRFLRGASDYSSTPGSKGGENTKTLYNNQMPNHDHNASVNNGGGHTHKYLGPRSYRNDSNGRDHKGANGNARTEYAGSHSHPSSNTANTGNSAGIDNRPRFVEMMFIQRL